MTLTTLGACPRIRRGRAHGACEASSRREEEGDVGAHPTSSAAGILRAAASAFPASGLASDFPAPLATSRRKNQI